jgi:quinol monooxygenase YgiN
MVVTVVWETWLNPGAETEGFNLTRQIWSDMRHFEGYISHRLLVDQDNQGHLLVISQWQSREAADRIRDEYAGSETVRRLTPLLSAPRERWVFSEYEAYASS